jgi:hypothetical protein
MTEKIMIVLVVFLALMFVYALRGPHEPNDS